MTLNQSAHIRSWYGVEREFERYHTRLRKKEQKKPIKIDFDHLILDAPENLNNQFVIQSTNNNQITTMQVDSKVSYDQLIEDFDKRENKRKKEG